MVRFDGVQSASGAKSYSNTVKSIQQQMEALASSLPDKIPEGMSESERTAYLDRAIKIKEKIIRLKEQLKNMAQQNDPSCVPELDKEIAALNDEKRALVDMQNNNTSVFSQNAKFANDKPSTSIFS